MRQVLALEAPVETVLHGMMPTVHNLGQMVSELDTVTEGRQIPQVAKLKEEAEAVAVVTIQIRQAQGEVPLKVREAEEAEEVVIVLMYMALEEQAEALAFGQRVEVEPQEP